MGNIVMQIENYFKVNICRAAMWRTWTSPTGSYTMCVCVAASVVYRAPNGDGLQHWFYLGITLNCHGLLAHSVLSSHAFYASQYYAGHQ